MANRNSSAGQDNQDNGADRTDEDTLRTSGSDEAINGNSAASDTGDQPDAAGPEGANKPAGSPDADDQGAKQRQTLLDAVRSAVKKPDAGEGSPSSESEDGSAESAKDPKAPKGDKGPADAKDAKGDQDLPFHNHPRWQELLRERDDLKADATQFRKVTAFCEQHGVSAAEAAEALTLVAAVKNDPRKAYEGLAPIVDHLREALGLTLPADLKNEVEIGAITEDRAKELARARADKALADRRAEGADRRAEESARRESDSANARRAEEVGRACESAVNAEEGKVRAADLDYAKKQPFIRLRLRELISETQAAGDAMTPDKATELYRDAHKYVTDNLRGMVRSQRQPVRHVPSGNSSASPGASAAPKTMFDAVKSALSAA
jgi:hypothetical protein